MPSEPNWALEAVKLIPTVILGAIAVYIAFAQWRTAHQKVVIDLFDRRMRVYEAVNNAIEGALTSSGVTTQDIAAMDKASLDATFLFGGEVKELIQASRKRLRELMDIGEQLKTEPDREKVRRLTARESEVIMPLFHLTSDLTALCEPYMKIDEKNLPHPLARVFMSGRTPERE